jgi:tetratricopeptide (TPR) repeat protein
MDYEGPSEAFESAIESIWASEDPKEALEIGEALVNKSAGLFAVGLYEEAQAAASEAVVRIGSSDGVSSALFHSATVRVGDALIGKGAELLDEARYDEGIKVLEDAYERFYDGLNPDYLRLAALALSKIVSGLARAGRIEEASRIRTHLVREYGHAVVDVPELGGEGT